MSRKRYSLEKASTRTIPPLKRIMALDIALHGLAFILIEFGLASLFVGAIAILEWYAVLTSAQPSLVNELAAVILTGITFNCLTLLILALGLRSEKVKLSKQLAMAEPRLKQISLYISIVILLPFVVLVVALYQATLRTAKF